MTEQNYLPAEEYEKLVALARRTLWIAYCWNDHNFAAPETYATSDAKTNGFKDLEDANKWLSSLPNVESDLTLVPPIKIDELDTALLGVQKTAGRIATAAGSARTAKLQETIPELVKGLGELVLATQALSSKLTKADEG